MHSNTRQAKSRQARALKRTALEHSNTSSSAKLLVSALEHSNTKWYWVNHGRTIMHSNTRQAKSRQARALKRQASCLLRVDAFGRRAVEVIICMITRDFSVISIDVTGVSLSLSQASLSLSLYYSQKSLTHNIGNAFAFPII